MARPVQNLDRLKAKLTRLRKTTEPDAERGLLKAGEIINAEQKRLAPVQSGDLRDANKVALTRGAKTGNVAVKVVNTDHKAGWVEFGTAAHTIEPKNAEALQIGDGFAEKVEHPGATARPFFFPGYRARKKQARAAIGKAARDGVKKAVQ